MPVSHLGLTVSHIPSATSFFLAALQPLGYRYIGYRGDSIGLGVDSADFFLTQSPSGIRPSPNHIAFLAETRLIVRECYAAALDAGGLPSGAPNYRNNACSCFNAAVEDLDGNTIEFLFKQPHGEPGCCGTVISSRSGGRRDVGDEFAHRDDDQSIASGDSLTLSDSRRSRTQTALDLATTTSKSTKHDAPRPQDSSSHRSSVERDFNGKAVIGTAIGAAAGAALIYSLLKTESKNSQEEVEHLANMSAKARSHEVPNAKRFQAPKAKEVLLDNPPVYVPAPKAESRMSRRNFSTTESAYSRPLHRQTRAMRMIAATGYRTHDDNVQETLKRYDGLRSTPTRDRKYDDFDHIPVTNAARSVHGMKRASTLPAEVVDRPSYDLESSTSRSRIFHQGLHREDAALSSHAGSRHEMRRKSHNDAPLTRHDSGIAMHPVARSRYLDAGRRSSASTIRPSARYRRLAAELSSRQRNYGSRAPSSCFHPAAISLPASSAAPSSKLTAIRRPSSPVQAPPLPPPILDPVASKQSWEDFELNEDESEDEDGLADAKTVFPDDSISCVDPNERRTRRRRKHRHHPGEASEVSGTARPPSSVRRERASLIGSLPCRERPRDVDSGKRSVWGF